MPQNLTPPAKSQPKEKGAVMLGCDGAQGTGGSRAATESDLLHILPN